MNSYGDTCSIWYGTNEQVGYLDVAEGIVILCDDQFCVCDGGFMVMEVTIVR